MDVATVDVSLGHCIRLKEGCRRRRRRLFRCLLIVRVLCSSPRQTKGDESRCTCQISVSVPWKEWTPLNRP